MALTNRQKTTLPAIPKVTLQDKQLQQFCDSVTSFLAIHGGRVGSGLDRAVTVREMIDSGFATGNTNIGNALGGGDGGITIKPEVPDGEIEIPVELPTQPTGFEVISGVTSVMLVWDNVNFDGAANTIIYRASSDDFSTAVILATTPASVYADITDNSETYYYWIRHTNIEGAEGPLNDATGTMGQAGLLTTNPDGEMIIANELFAESIYAIEITAINVTGGTLDFGGGRFTVDENGNVTASSLTINYGGYARSENYVAGQSGWVIYGNGNVEFNDGIFRGDIYAEDGYFKGTVYADKIVGDLATCKAFTASQVEVSGEGQRVLFDTVRVIAQPYPRTLVFKVELTVSHTVSGSGGPSGSSTGRVQLDGVIGVVNSRTVSVYAQVIGEGSRTKTVTTVIEIYTPLPSDVGGDIEIYAQYVDIDNQGGGFVQLSPLGNNNQHLVMLFRDGTDLVEV
ncbi:hypothetical protein ACNO5M_13335 [Vibrio owensii]|uniref:hypothetical protein n=1 Tax=Vibrio owensii TaxID=696485 RepID=UPI003AB09B18